MSEMPVCNENTKMCQRSEEDEEERWDVDTVSGCDFLEEWDYTSLYGYSHFCKNFSGKNVSIGCNDSMENDSFIFGTDRARESSMISCDNTSCYQNAPKFPDEIRINEPDHSGHQDDPCLESEMLADSLDFAGINRLVESCRLNSHNYKIAFPESLNEERFMKTSEQSSSDLSQPISEKKITFTHLLPEKNTNCIKNHQKIDGKIVTRKSKILPYSDKYFGDHMMEAKDFSNTKDVNNLSPDMLRYGNIVRSVSFHAYGNEMDLTESSGGDDTASNRSQTVMASPVNDCSIQTSEIVLTRSDENQFNSPVYYCHPRYTLPRLQYLSHPSLPGNRTRQMLSSNAKTNVRSRPLSCTDMAQVLSCDSDKLAQIPDWDSLSQLLSLKVRSIIGMKQSSESGSNSNSTKHTDTQHLITNNSASSNSSDISLHNWLIREYFGDQFGTKDNSNTLATVFEGNDKQSPRNGQAKAIQRRCYAATPFRKPYCRQPGNQNTVLKNIRLKKSSKFYDLTYKIIQTANYVLQIGHTDTLLLQSGILHLAASLYSLISNGIRVTCSTKDSRLSAFVWNVIEQVAQTDVRILNLVNALNRQYMFGDNTFKFCHFVSELIRNQMLCSWFEKFAIRRETIRQYYLSDAFLSQISWSSREEFNCIRTQLAKLNRKKFFNDNNCMVANGEQRGIRLPTATTQSPYNNKIERRVVRMSAEKNDKECVKLPQTEGYRSSKANRKVNIRLKPRMSDDTEIVARNTHAFTVRNQFNKPLNFCLNSQTRIPRLIAIY